MVTGDTIELLKECDSGIKMGVSAIDDVLNRVTDHGLENILAKSKEKHEKIETEITELLHSYGDTGKEPNPAAKGMAWLKTNLKMSMNESDQTASDLITDGCNMGIKTLQKYLNQYEKADDKAKALAKKVISTEEALLTDLREYL